MSATRTVRYAVHPDPQAIKRYRYAKGLRLADLADLAGISHPFMSRIECGRRTASPGVLKRIADALGVEVDDITTMHEAAAATGS